ncbi:hypothetical protein ABZ869_07000 [Streptomyces sp. NPDC046928]|uniref:hypothetical protein n=1 Tax=Streptomyces sp. NPDC046928 TaxID=3155021 RepID=UPI0033C16DF8
MTRLRWCVALSGWVALVATALPEASPLRVGTTVAFLLVCPGLAATLRGTGHGSRREDGRTAVLAQAVLAGAVSVSLSALVAEALFLVGLFSPVRALLVLAALTSAMVLVPDPRLPERWTSAARHPSAHRRPPAGLDR